MTRPVLHYFLTLLSWLVPALPASAQDTALVRTNTSDSTTVTRTLTNGASIALGLPRTIRWSIAKDGAVLPTYYYAGSNPNRPSLLITDLDNDFSVAAGSRGADLTIRPWYPYFTSMLDRIAKKSGLSFTYEPNDDGASIGTDGAAGVRGDLRFGGGPLTGALGYNGIPNNSSQPDMVLDTNRIWNGTDLRFVAGHEYHHGLGFGHVQVEANGNASAVAASGGNSNGPQFHDLIQLHRKYGDPYEKPAGNGARTSATQLGSLSFGTTVRAGSDWDDIWIGADETGFATISATGDVDFYRVDTSGPMQVRAVLTPKGPVYSYVTEGQTSATVNASKFMNLRFEVQDSAGAVIATAAAQPAGVAETLPALQLPAAGTWYFRVSMEGSSTSPQAYRLEISDSDTDGDGLSDSGEFAVGRNPTDPADLAFSFTADGDQEGWTGGGGVSPRTVSGGSSNGTISGSDPQILRTGFGFAGSGVPHLLIRARSSTTGSLQVFWGRTGADAFEATRVQTLNITQANTWTLLNFNLAAHAQWAGQTITRIRIDPPGGTGASFAIDFIAGQNGASNLVWQSGSGNWDAVTANWRLDTNPLSWLTGSRAIFPADAGTVTLTNNTNAAGLEFESGGYTLDGTATLTLAAGADLTTPSGTTTINCPLNASALTKSGTGTLVLTGPVPPFSGLTLQGGTVTFQPPTDSAINAPISGAGALAKSGSTTLTLAGANSFSGNVAINSGALRLTRSDSLGTGTKTITMTNGSAGKCRIILAGGASPIVLPAGISINSSNNDAALPAVLNESGDNTIQGNFTLTAGGGGTRMFSQAGSLTLSGVIKPNTGGRVVHLDGPGAGIVSGVIADQNATNILALEKVGTGTWTLSGVNTFTGNSAVRAGTLLVNGSLASTVTVHAGGTLGGTGTVAGLSLATGTATVSPGSGGIGKLAATGTATLGAGARYLWEIHDWTGAAGAGADLLECGTLSLTVTPANPLVIAVTPNQLVNFQNTARTFVIASGTSSMTGFNAAAIQINSSAFPAASGTWTARQTGNTLELSYEPDGYESWIAATGLTGTAAEPTADPDADGMANLIEWVIGGEPNPANPNASSIELSPTLVFSPTHLVFTYRRTDLSANQPGITIGAEYGSDLTAWSPASHGANGVSIQITDHGFGTGIDRVDVSIPRSLAVGGKLLARLKVIIP
jgi:autotransporter-associated beta strand protein